MLKRTLAGLALVLAASAFNSAPASAFGWCSWGYGATYAPRAYSYAPRTYYRPRVRLYRPAFYGRTFYRPRARFYRPAFYGRTFYRPGVRLYRPAFYGRTYRRAAFRPVVTRAYRPAVARSFYRSNVRVSQPRARAIRSEVRGFGTGDRARFRGRLP